MSAPSLRLSSEVGFKQWIEKAIDSPDPSVREEETSFCLQNVNAVIALIKFDTAAAPFEVAGVSSSGEKEEVLRIGSSAQGSQGPSRERESAFAFHPALLQFIEVRLESSTLKTR